MIGEGTFGKVKVGFNRITDRKVNIQHKILGGHKDTGKVQDSR